VNMELFWNQREVYQK